MSRFGCAVRIFNGSIGRIRGGMILSYSNEEYTQEFLDQFKIKMDVAINRFKVFEPQEGYYLCFSGGKDSQCIYHLAKQAGVKFDAHYSLTGVDPPELVQFIKANYPDVEFKIPRYSDGSRITMWNLIVRHKMPPSRAARYCCTYLKETAGGGRMSVTGVRWAESANRRKRHDVVDMRGKPVTTRKIADEMGVEYRAASADSLVLNDDNDISRRFVEQCYRTRTALLNPIVDWSDKDVWYYLNEVAKVPHCSLYDEGFKRIGCVGCPLASQKHIEREFARYPKFKNLYLRAFDRMIKERERASYNIPKKYTDTSNDWSTPEKVFEWWVSDEKKKRRSGRN